MQYLHIQIHPFQIDELKSSSWKYYYRRPTCLIGDLSESSTCFIRDQHSQLETDIPHQRPTFPIGDQLPWWETDMPLLNMLMYPFGLRSGMLLSDGSPIRHVCLWWGMLVSEGSSIMHVDCLVSDRSPIKVCQYWNCVNKM